MYSTCLSIVEEEYGLSPMKDKTLNILFDFIGLRHPISMFCLIENCMETFQQEL